MNLFVIETMMPDGPHWYSGIRSVEKDGAVVRGPEWSPYWEDRKELNKQQADVTYELVCKQMGGCYITSIDDARKKDAWKTVDKNPNHWQFRAKYLRKGLIVRLPGYTGQYRVVNKDHAEFTLVACNVNGSMSGNGGNTFYIGINNEKLVTVIGEIKEVASEANN